MRGCVEEEIDYRGTFVSRHHADESRPEGFGVQRALRRSRKRRFISRVWKMIWWNCSTPAPAARLDKIELKWNPEASVCVVMASGGYPGNYPKGKIISGLRRRERAAAHKSFSRRHGVEGRPNRHERRSRPRRDGAGQRFKCRASRRLRRRGENPFRRRALPPRHRGEGVLPELDLANSRRASFHCGPYLRGFSKKSGVAPRENDQFTQTFLRRWKRIAFRKAFLVPIRINRRNGADGVQSRHLLGR